MKHLVFLGRVVSLCEAELSAILKRKTSNFTSTLILPRIVLVESDLEDLEFVIQEAGGVLKIAKVLDLPSMETEDLAEEQLFSLLVKGSTAGKLNLGAFSHEKGKTTDLGLSLKKKLSKHGVSARYLKGEQSGLNAAQFIHNKATEFHLVQTESGFIIAETLFVQDIDAWSERDYGKPYRDPKRGMLPPKLARIMINLAVTDKELKDVVIYDPFCGTGTVLLEAMTVGSTAIGSDVASEAVFGAGKNLQWLAQTRNIEKPYTLSIQDATQDLSKAVNNGLVDAIVTEPFLGKPNPTPATADNILKGLEKLYLGFLKKAKTVLKKNGKLVIVFPKFIFPKTVKTVTSVIDRLESLGYTRENGPYLYTRPQTVVQREIYILSVT